MTTWPKKVILSKNYGDQSDLITILHFASARIQDKVQEWEEYVVALLSTKSCLGNIAHSVCIWVPKHLWWSNGGTTGIDTHQPNLSPCRSWSELGLPVCGRMLAKAQSYLCSLVVRFICITMDEAAKINGILVSIKCFRASQVGYCVKEVIITNWFVSKTPHLH